MCIGKGLAVQQLAIALTCPLPAFYPVRPYPCFICTSGFSDVLSPRSEG